MGYLTWLERLNGDKKVFRANSELQLKKMRSEYCRKFSTEKFHVGPIIRDGKDFQFHMAWVIKPKVKS
jgi:hypothetical protein